MQNGIAILENSPVVAYKLNKLPYDPETPLLCINPREVKKYIHTNVCMLMFIAPLYTIMKNWKSKCPKLTEYNNISIQKILSVIETNYWFTQLQ